MGDVLFECTYTDSEEMLTESYRNVREKSKVDLGRALIIFSVCVLVLAIWLRQLSWGMLAVVLFGAGWYCLRLPAIKAQNVMNNIRRINNGTVPSARIVIDDKITHYYKLDTVVILHENLRFAYFLKRSIVLIGEEGYLTFDRAGFTKGSPEEFETYIREKCPYVQVFHKA